eukprot:11430843-Alexandrium_andersonii.AAC.1
MPESTLRVFLKSSHSPPSVSPLLFQLVSGRDLDCHSAGSALTIAKQMLTCVRELCASLPSSS